MTHDLKWRFVIGIGGAIVGACATATLNFAVAGEKISRGDATDFMRFYYATATSNSQQAWDNLLDPHLKGRHEKGYSEYAGYYESFSEVNHGPAIDTNTPNTFYVEVTYKDRQGREGAPQDVYVTLKCNDRIANRLPFVHCRQDDLRLVDTFNPDVSY